jgi:rRNA pseudouridine-1189 N-methylase Emg1 (Nep1/Mra1 family)
MNKNTNATKGHQGFVKSYPKLGKTVSIRVPESFEDFIKQMLSLCEQAEQIDPEHNKKLQKLVIKYLNGVVSPDNNV